MTRRQLRHTLAQRRQHPRGSYEWQYLTRAARKIVLILRGLPTTEWENT